MPEFQTLALAQEFNPYIYVRNSFFSAGLDNFHRAPGQDQDAFEVLENILPVKNGSLLRRWGYGKFNTSALTIVPRGAFIYRHDTDGWRVIVLSSASELVALGDDGAVHRASIFSPSALCRMATSRSYGYFASGSASDLKKWDGQPASTITKWGIDKPTTAPTVNTPSTLGGTNVTIVSGRKYTIAWWNHNTGHYSDIGPFSEKSDSATAQSIPLTTLPTAPGDAQVTRKVLLATADGGDESTLYLLADQSYGLALGDTTFTDDVSEEDLLLRPIYFETDEEGIERGLVDNTPPPATGTLPIKHRGRLYMLVGSRLYYSKSIEELITSTNTSTGQYEEAWPGDFFLDMALGAQIPRALFSDGEILYVGTERDILRVVGDKPQNFRGPGKVFTEVGVLNQDTWQAVFLNNVPVGAIWITPEFRVVKSDLNTYVNIGEPVQTTLDTINPGSASKSSSTFATMNGFNLYLLAIPTGSNTECDTLLVYNLETERWYTWKLGNAGDERILFQLFNIDGNGNPQILFGSNGSTIYRFASTITQDRVGNTPVNFVCKANTSWLDFGDPTVRKLLNELEVMTVDYTTLQFTLDGASLDFEFGTPVNYVTNTTPVVGPLGDIKVYLAGVNPASSNRAGDRFFRFSFTYTGLGQNMLSYLAAEVVPLSRF
jgi:hypothetical protein